MKRMWWFRLFYIFSNPRQITKAVFGTTFWNFWSSMLCFGFQTFLSERHRRVLCRRNTHLAYQIISLVPFDSWLKTKLYDKKDDFSFSTVNFPFLSSNIQAAPAYGVYISQLIRYSRACISYHDFLDRGLLLTRKVLNKEFQMQKLKSSLRKFYGRHHDLVDRYGIRVSQMISDMFLTS